MEDLWFVQSGQKRRAEKVICKYCNKEFLRRKTPIGKEPFSIYCGPECSSKAGRNRIKLQCWMCKKEFERAESKIKGAIHGIYFCSRKCKDKAQSLVGGCTEIRPCFWGNNPDKRCSIAVEMLKKGCIDCGEKRGYYLNLHHIDGDRRNNKIENWEIVCVKDHVKRHLKLVHGEWVYCTSALTPRESLKEL